MFSPLIDDWTPISLQPLYIKSVVFEEGSVCKSIGVRAFYYCRSLTSVEIPDSVTTIGDSAFRSCTSLASVEIPDSVTTIGNSAFDYCIRLTSVEIGDSVTTIGDCAFGDCLSLTSVEIPDSVTRIGAYAFYNCSSLSSVTFKDTTTWYVTDYASYKYGESVDVTDALTNASRFSSDSYYGYKYWYKN